MNPDMRVLHVTFDMKIGGAEQVIRQLIPALASRGIANEVVCIDGESGPLGASLSLEGVPAFVLNRQAGFDWRLIFALRRLLRQRKIDIVHCHQYTPYVYGVLAALGTCHRVVFTEHGRFHPDHASAKRRLANPWLNRITAATTAISSATAEALTRVDNIPAGSIEIIYNGIADKWGGDSGNLRAELAISPDELVFGTISRLDPIKNQTMMVDAFAELLRERPACRLLIVGDGIERQALEARVAWHGIGSQVHFVGFQAEPDRYLHLLDVLLLTSRSEGTSMTLLEAMSAGKACIATHVGGNPEIIETSENGLLVPSEDTPALIAAMRRLVDHPAERTRLAAAARQSYLQRFTIEQMTERYVALYRALRQGTATRLVASAADF